MLYSVCLPKRRLNSVEISLVSLALVWRLKLCSRFLFFSRFASARGSSLSACSFSSKSASVFRGRRANLAMLACAASTTFFDSATSAANLLAPITRSWLSMTLSASFPRMPWPSLIREFFRSKRRLMASRLLISRSSVSCITVMPSPNFFCSSSAVDRFLPRAKYSTANKITRLRPPVAAAIHALVATVAAVATVTYKPTPVRNTTQPATDAATTAAFSTR